MSNKSHSHYLITHKVLPKFFIALLITFAGMFIGASFIPASVAVFMPFIAIILLIFAFFAKGKRSKEKRYDYASSKITLSLGFVYFIAFILGIGMYPAIGHYASEIGADMVLLGLGITVVLFGALSLYAYKTKEDFTNMGTFLFLSLLALILLSIAGIFIDATLFHMVLAFAGIVIFSGYILYDISCMKRADFTEEDVPMAVLDLLLDFINILLDVLRLISIFKD